MGSAEKVYNLKFPKVHKDSFDEAVRTAITKYASAKVSIEKRRLEYFVFYLVWVLLTMLLIVAFVVNLYYGRNFRPFIAALAFYIFIFVSGCKRMLQHKEFIDYCNRVLEKSGYYNEFHAEFFECGELLLHIDEFKQNKIYFAEITDTGQGKVQVEGVKKDGSYTCNVHIFVYQPSEVQKDHSDFSFIDGIYEQILEDIKEIESDEKQLGFNKK